ncbi:hypothetical protein-signal peptide prediction [Rhodopirellula baltica SH 1]|uniref:Uncharacterized protein n=1 Tax=Rhodopirellula baltica (strain DSM 10527 / NCIMB 13988 / SH1) TaxID=243090 RepID=Q7US75_RHOBA|nr:hypothetical protein-signal peptide prediction [Rhodopirellula baltica SH 1]
MVSPRAFVAWAACMTVTRHSTACINWIEFADLASLDD